MSKYFVRIKGKQLGPFDADDLKQLVEIGRLSPGDHVRLDGQENWLLAEKIRGLDFSKKNNSESADPSFEVIEEAEIDAGPDEKPKAQKNGKKKVKNLANENPLQNLVRGLLFRKPHTAGNLLVWILRFQMVAVFYSAARYLKEDDWKLYPASYTVLGMFFSYFMACWLASEVVVLLRSCAKSLYDLSDES
jgi:hypothetical protein